MSSETSQYLIAKGEIELNAGRRTDTLTVANTADRAIQVGSHFHFFEVNKALRFHRERALGMRLDIPAGTAVRFEPGDTKDVQLVELGGAKRVQGLNGLVNGDLNDPTVREQAVGRATERGFIMNESSSGQEGEQA